MSAEATPDIRQSRLGLLLIPILALYCAWAMFPLTRCWRAMEYPFQLDNVEGFLLDEAVQLSQGEGIYAPIDEAPYLVGNYPPVFQLAWAALTKVSGAGLAQGRALCFGALCGILLIMLLFALRTGKQALPALLCPLLFLATYECNNWAAYARADIPSIFFAIAGLGCFMTFESRSGRIAAAALFALGFLTKQTALAAPAACIVVLLFRNWRQGLFLAAMFGGIVISVTALLTLLTGGQYYLHTIAYNVNEMRWAELGDVWIPHLLWFYGAYILAIAVALLFVLVRLLPLGRPKSEKELHPHSSLSLPAVYFVLSAATIVSIAKAGSAENYLLEPLVAGALLFSSVLGVALRESANVRRAWIARAFALAMMVCLGWHCYRAKYNETEPGNGFSPSAAAFSRGMRVDAARGQALLERVRATQGDVICEDPIFAVLTGRRPTINPFILSQLAREGVWDESPFIRDIESKHFALIVTTTDIHAGTHFARYTNAMIQAMRQNYQYSETFDLGYDGQIYHTYSPN